MATREEKQIRLELPSTSGVECEIRENIGRKEYIINFYQNERQLKSCAITLNKLNQDNMVDLLSDAGVEFFSFSAIFDVADLLLNTIKENFIELPMGEKTVIDVSKKTQKTEKLDEIVSTEVLDVSQSILEPERALEHKKGAIIDPRDKLLMKFKMPYSRNGFAGIYFSYDGNYSVVIFEKNTPVASKRFSKDLVRQDDIVNMITDAGIEFLSFSAIYDSAEKIENIIIHPEEYIESEKTVQIPQEISEEGDISEDTGVLIPESEISQDELVMVDLSAFDASEYTDAKDFDKFLKKITEYMTKGQPLPVKEIDIENSGGVVCIILRQMDEWFLRFRYTDGSLSNINKTKINQDEIAQIINNNIPQISFSYLYDASEKLFKLIEELMKRPIGDIILNVAIGHFMKVIEQHEAEGNLKQAAKVTEVLFERSKRERNARGMLQFGKKLVQYLEARKKASKAIKLRNELVEELLNIDADSALTFVLESLDPLTEQEKYLNAATLCGLILDHYLTEEEVKIGAISTILLLAKRQVDFYKRARLPVVLWENALRYGHHTIQLIAKFGISQFDHTTLQSLWNDIYYLLDSAFEIQEERKSHFELLESLETTLDLFKIAGNKEGYSRYVDRTILTADSQNNKDKSLQITLDAADFLMDSNNYIKSCNLANQAIKFFYELNRVDEAVEFSLGIISGLIELKETDAARDYLKFVENLIDKAYANDESLRVEKQLTLGDLFGQLGDRDHGKSYIQKALGLISDQKKREKIVLKYVDDLLASKAFLTAQEMVNLELSRLLTEKKTSDVLNFVATFINNLKTHGKHDMVFEYMKYCSNLMYQTGTIDYALLNGFIMDLLHLNAVDHAAFILESLLAIQVKDKDFTRAIDSLSLFIDHLLKNTERSDLVKKYVFQTAEAYQQMGDPEGALERLIIFQKEIIDYSVDVAQNITDWVLKELERTENYKKAIEVVSIMIDKQMELQRYQDAYIFTVQNARYYESLGDIEKVIKYLEKMRNTFVDRGEIDEANRMTDLIIRFGRSHKQYKLVINSIKNYSKESLDKGDTKTAARFALEMASLLEEDNKSDKSLEYLQMVFNSTYEKDKLSSLQIFHRILEIREKHDDFKKIAKKYLEPLFQKHLDLDLVKEMKEVLEPSFEDYMNFIEQIYDLFFERLEVSSEIASSIVEFVNSTFINGFINDGDRLVNKYTVKLLNFDQINAASSLMALVLEKTAKPLSELLTFSFNFIKELINRALVEAAREFVDRVVKIVIARKELGNEGKLLAAKLTEKFAFQVATENPDLASEYAYQASDFYRSLNNFESIVEVYLNLANHYSSPKRSIRVFKRGINVCKKFKAKKYEAQLLTYLTKYLIEVQDNDALSALQQTLEKLEELEDLEQLFNAVLLLVETAIEADNMNIAYTYLDYMCRLSSMISATERVGGVLIFLSNFAKERDDKSHLELAEKYIEKLAITPKKYKKDYTSLVERRIKRLESISRLEEVIEPVMELEKEIIKEPSEIPEIVETSEIIPPQQEIPVPSLDDLGEEVDEEFVSVIKTFEKEIPSEELSAEGLEKSSEDLQIPDISGLADISQAIEPKIQTEVTDTSIIEESLEGEVSTPSKSDEMEEIPLEGLETSETPALSDEEISGLFSKESIYSKEAQEIESEVPLEDIPIEEEMTKSKRFALTEDEMQHLFRPIKDTSTKPVTKKISASDGDKWEVDEFGRLIEREAPKISEDADQIIAKEKLKPDTIEFKTPDLSILDLSTQKPKEETESSIEYKSVLEEAIKESQVTTDVEEVTETEMPSDSEKIFGESKPSTFSSIIDSLTEDEESSEADVFKMPEVAYEEITPRDIPKKVPEESQVKPPDLAALFSDALSELSSISGEPGEASQEKKKKK